MGYGWEVARSIGVKGVLWLAPDVALDPDDLAAMDNAVAAAPDEVHTGLVKLWPVSTGRKEWMWSHRTGSVGNPVATQDETAPVTYFSMDACYMPHRLLDAGFPRAAQVAWMQVDVVLSEVAAVNGIPASVVPGCRPKHLHFSREHNGDQTATP